MATPNQHPLQILDQMFNEVLVQTGKHLKANAKDGPKSSVSVNNAVRIKASDSLTAYHYALDDFESEIMRAKAVVLRDLEKLRAARAPPPQPVAPPAPMMDLPSSAAHTISTPAFVPKQDIKTAAPFPDMGMGLGMSNNVVDLTSSDKKPSPRVPAGAVRPQARPAPQTKNEVRPSPKQASKPTPRLNQPPKVTPVPVPQIPRPQGFQAPHPPGMGPAAATQSRLAAQNTQSVRQAQATPTVHATKDTSITAVPVPPNAATMPPHTAGGETSATGGNNGLKFTDLQFSLAPSTTEAPGAPPAPMPEFDLTTFAPQDTGNGMPLNNSRPGNAASGQSAAAAAPQQQPKAEDKPDTNLDDLFNLDTGNGADGMFDLGGGGGNDSTFDDMMYFDNNDSEMQLDEAYFLP
ncbi:hypothetical protein F4804DRAFT_301282 [Jackrogersella minutella]|nr:hypothetical protein F4804DRAFT_301282 [Jackrogersella minutella]